MQRTVNITILVLIVLLGGLVGRFGAQWLEIALERPAAGPSLRGAPSVSAPSGKRADFSLIAKRNIFDSTAKPEPVAKSQPVRTVSDKPRAAAPGVKLTLLGTIAGGQKPLAVIKAADKTRVYRLGDELPGGSKLIGVERRQVLIELADGSLNTLGLPLEKRALQRSKQVQARAGSQVVNVGENRWQIPRQEAERARSNLNALLKTARMVPMIVNGQTQGFTVVEIEKRSFLDLLGLKVGDVVVQINDVELNSPEKALQIFQQVRQANNISLGLLRGGKRMTFEYEIN